MARIAERREEIDAALLRERLAAGHADVPRAEPGDGREDLPDRAPLAAVERVRGVAPDAAERAAREPHEDGRPAGRVRLALQRMEDLGDAKARCDAGIGVARNGFAQRRLSDFSARRRPCARCATVVSGYVWTTWFNVASA